MAWQPSKTTVTRMNGIDLLPLAVAHMIGLGAMGSCIGIGLWFATANPFAR